MNEVVKKSLDEANESRKYGKRIFLGFLSFFIIFSSMNAFFAYKAISTLPGVVSENAYEIGLNYNKIIAEAKKREIEKNEHSHRAPAASKSGTE